MHLILLALGAATALAGLIMVGFGIPINEFGIGNTLISAGTTAIVGGFVLIGLSAAVRQLRGLIDALEVRAPPPSVGPASFGSESIARARMRATRASVSAPPTSPAVSSERESRWETNAGFRDDVAPEPRPATSTRGAPGGFDAAVGRGASSYPDEEDEEEFVEEAPAATRYVEEAPTSVSPFAPSRAESRAEPRGESRAEPRAESRAEPRAESRAETPRRAPQKSRGFDTIWPPEPAPPPSDSRSRADASPFGAAPFAAGPENEHDIDRGYEEAELPSPPAGAQAVSILKSGVIDGMAYTLYTDGSIEAELPQGTLRFGSIDDLRDYLANKE